MRASEDVEVEAAPPLLPCGHTKAQHGNLDCAQVKRIAADSEWVERREARWGRGRVLVRNPPGEGRRRWRVGGALIVG